MLVLSMRPGDQTVIDLPDGSLGVVQIIAVDGQKVRVAFTFPSDWRIARDHLWRELLAQGETKYAVLDTEIMR